MTEISGAAGSRAVAELEIDRATMLGVPFRAVQIAEDEREREALDRFVATLRGSIPANRRLALEAIAAERLRQIEKWGPGPIPEGRELSVLTEEVGEVARAINDHEPLDQLRDELVQVAAVCVRWLEFLG